MNRAYVASIGTFLLAGMLMAASEELPANPAHLELSALTSVARSRVMARPRVDLAVDTAGLVNESDSLEAVGSGRIPNYLRAVAKRPGASKAFAHAVKVLFYSGSLPSEMKLGMGLRIAQLDGSPYVAAHVMRLLRCSERGQAILAAIDTGHLDSLGMEERLALKYADALSPDVRGVSDSDFRIVRGYFNDTQIVELTMTVCFFEYFARFVEAVNLPVEEWALDSPPHPPVSASKRPLARVGLISDEEMAATSGKYPATQETIAMMAAKGLGTINSYRARMRCPEINETWSYYWSLASKPSSVSQEVLGQVTFAVSTANGCRYCIHHNVVGLRSLGVSVAKLIALQKDDSALTQQELIAVQFARKLTRKPASITDGDYHSLRGEFGEEGAVDIVQRICDFAYRNRVTDGLRVPPEEFGLQTYRAVYGTELK